MSKEESCSSGNKGSRRSNLRSVSDVSERIIYYRIKILALGDQLYFEGVLKSPGITKSRI